MNEIREALVTGDFILTARVAAFERDYAQWMGVADGIGVGSGYDALVIALLACGVTTGSSVVVQANTFYATVSAVLAVGATPILIDADSQTFNMDLSVLGSLDQQNVRAIMPVHLFGLATAMEPVIAFAGQTDCFIIEDAAQAHGAAYRGIRVGAWGHAGCFSFHPSKNLSAAGDAGIIVSNDGDIAARARTLRGLGQSGQNHHVVAPSFNSKLDSIQATVLSWKLRYLDGWNKLRSQVAELYRERLRDHPLGFQHSGEEGQHVYHLMQLLTPDRDRLFDYLSERGIDVSIRYPTPIHLQPAFEGLGYRKGAFPVAEKLANELLTLPVRPDLSSDEVEIVCDAIDEFFRGRPANLARPNADAAVVTEPPFYTISLSLDDITVVDAPCPSPISLRRLINPSIQFYRWLYQTIGQEFGWGGRLRRTDDALMHILQETNRHILLADASNGPIGFVELHACATTWTIDYLGLIPEARGKKLNEPLLRKAIIYARENGAIRTKVSTRTIDHPAALHTYKKLGFTVRSRIPS